MRLSLRSLVLFSLLLGAIGVPWASRIHQQRREAEIERLSNEEFDLSAQLIAGTAFVGNAQKGTLSDSEIERIRDRLEVITNRLNKLTGNATRYPYEFGIGPRDYPSDTPLVGP